MKEYKLQVGFTLVEVLVVIGLIGITAAAYFSVSQFSQQSKALSAAVRNFTTDLRYAQQLSVTEQMVHGIQISLASGSYRLIRFSTTTVEFFDKNLPTGIAFQDVSGFTSDEIRFNAYGAVLEDGTITLANTDSATTTIEVRPSGFVRIL
ncbi:MAG: prepilin-type N-terminal cleavage/methylation domain-containing protein [Parcubacteria group bacterium]|nr:prepilin-type N-terminal cleavage/methylation domain-containing protein [Parcubacteria group bacterium]